MDSAPAHDLITAFTTAYRPWVEQRLGRLETPAAEAVAAAVDEGEAWLRAELEALLARPAGDQHRGPLEVFQEAMQFPTEALAAAGVPEVERDDGARRALPGDRYDLAPASSQPLGDEAWRAHLAWGAAKAAALAGSPPAQVLYVGNNLMDRTTIEAAASRSGLRLAVARSAEEAAASLGTGRAPLVVLVDLTAADSDDALRAAAASGAKVIAFGPHVDDWALDRARSLGAIQALPRSRFFRTLDELLPKRV